MPIKTAMFAISMKYTIQWPNGSNAQNIAYIIWRKTSPNVLEVIKFIGVIDHVIGWMPVMYVAT